MVTTLDDYHISVGGSSPLKGTNKCLTIKKDKIMCKIDSYKREVARVAAPFSAKLKSVIFAIPKNEQDWRELCNAVSPISLLFHATRIGGNFLVRESIPTCGCGNGIITVNYDGNTEYYSAFYRKIERECIDSDVKAIAPKTFKVCALFKSGNEHNIFEGTIFAAKAFVENYKNEKVVRTWITPVFDK